MDKVSLGSVAALQAYAGSAAVTSDPMVVDQAMIDAFARTTHDEQWIHVDPARAAAESPFGTTIAHGLLTLSLIPGMYHRLFVFPGRKFALNYGFDKVRFTAPVTSGSALVGSFVLARVDAIGDSAARCFWDIDIRTQGAAKPAVVAQWLMQLTY